MNFGIVRAILKKDVLSLLPLLAAAALLFFGDAVITRLNLVPIWTQFGPPVLLVALVAVVLSVFQQDSPASLTDDWLGRPLRVRELLAAKFALVASAVYLPQALGAFAAGLALGFPVQAALLDAILLPDQVFPFLLLFFLLAAIVTRTLVQGLGLLFVIFICVFAVPTPFVRPPGPLTPGIREALFVNGLLWLSVTPARLAATVFVIVGFWLVYGMRQLVAARALLAIMVVVTVFLLVLPMGLAPWASTFAAQKTFGPRLPGVTAADVDRISLRNPRPCFPAARRAEMSTDGAFVAATRGLRLWDAEELRDMGADFVAFLTTIEPRGLPLDWRVKLNYAQAEYFDGDTALYALRPANYLTDGQDSGPLRHAWLLPDPALQRLQGPATKLKLTYSLTLLKPSEHRLAVDGAWHSLPGIGVCQASARPGNTIAVECFSAWSRPAQISAELNDIPATRDFGNIDLTPGWARWAYSSRVKLTIGSARLARHDSITVTAWDAASYLDESLTLPGILGADLPTCPLPTSGAGNFQKARWRDVAPHESNTLTVEDGVQLEVLDFGGTGSPVVLLPGLGATAHAYDDLAPLLAKQHRVIAITRRGTGYSSRPDFGFDTPRLAQDVLSVMDQLDLRKALLVGHSIAGDELTWLGGHHGDRFSGLIYLDAAYDRSGDHSDARNRQLRELNRGLPPDPPIPSKALLNYDALSQYLEEQGRTRYPEGELIAFLNIDKPYVANTPNMDVRVQQAIKAAIQSPDYPAVKIPALAVYAFEDPAKDRSATHTAIRELSEAMKRENMEVFRRSVVKGEVRAMPNATHYIFLSNPHESLEIIEDFAARLP